MCFEKENTLIRAFFLKYPTEMYLILGTSFATNMKKKIGIVTKQRQVIFTQKQLEVIELWSEKGSVSEVANTLGISKHTVYTKLKRMRKKLNVNRTFDVYKYAKEQELI